MNIIGNNNTTVHIIIQNYSFWGFIESESEPTSETTSLDLDFFLGGGGGVVDIPKGI